MNKALLAFAALPLASAASAQSSVTMFGIIDAGVSHYQTTSRYVDPANPAAAVGFPDLKQSQTVLSSGNNLGSRLGFRGLEDLGGGMSAGFWLEAGFANDTGAAFAPNGLGFNRRSTVSLSGKRFGEVRLGRDYTPTFLNDNLFDPFATVGAGANALSVLLGGSSAPGTVNALIANPNYVRANNSVGYFLPPDLGGIYGQVMYGFGENVKFDPGTSTPNTPNTARTGRYVGGRLGYAKERIDVAVAYGSSTVADDYYGGKTSYLNTGNIGASYDFGLLKLFGEYSHVELKNEYVNNPVFPAVNGDAKIDGYLLGVAVPVGAGQIRASYSHVEADLRNAATGAPGLGIPDPKTDKLSLGYLHNLSKRTALYATAAYTRNRNGAALPPALPPNGTAGYTNPTLSGVANQVPGYRADDGYGYDIGIRHIF